MLIKKILLGFTVIIAISCDCQFHISGKDLDFDSKLPIDKVSISEDTTDLDNSIYFSYKSGDFEFSRTSGICDKKVLFFSKEGYKTKRITIENNKTDTIYLKKN